MVQVPGLGSVAYLMTCSAPSREETTALLAAGNIVGVAPGGGRQVANKQTNKQTTALLHACNIVVVAPDRESGREYSFEQRFPQAMLCEGWGHRRGYAAVALKVKLSFLHGNCNTTTMHAEAREVQSQSLNQDLLSNYLASVCNMSYGQLCRN